MPGLDVAFLVIVTTSTRLSPLDCTVLISEIFFGLYFQTRTFAQPLIGPCPFSIAVRPNLARDLRWLRQPGRATSSGATADPKKDPSHQRIQTDISHCHPLTLGQNFRPRPPRCENFTRPPWSDCDRSTGRSNSSAVQGGGKRRAVLLLRSFNNPNIAHGTVAESL